MAEGGGEFGYENTDLDYQIDHDSDEELVHPNDYDDDAVQEALSETQPFQPGQASTPYHGGEQIQMQTMQHEQSGLPDTSYAETPLLGDSDPIGDLHFESSLRKKMKKAVDMIKGRYPEAEIEKLKIRRGKGKDFWGQIVATGRDGGQYQILRKDESSFTQSFLKRFKSNLGTPAEEILLKERDTIQEQLQRNEEAEKQLREAEKIAAEREKELQEMENLKQQTERIQARIDAIQEDQGSNLESEAELRRLKQLKKNHQTEYEKKKKEVAALKKKAKNKQRVEDKAAKERAKLDELVKKRNLIEERLNNTKALDDLNAREAELHQQNAEDQAIIDDTNTTLSEKEAARDRIEERIEELARLHTQIAEREEAMPLCERIKEIFKKHGVTVTAIVIAAGVTIGSVVSSIAKGLKATGKAMAGGLKEIGTKLGSLLPGLIGQVASFLFNTAAKAVGFLAEHTWLIILAVVAFLFQKYIKKRR